MDNDAAEPNGTHLQNAIDGGGMVGVALGGHENEAEPVPVAIPATRSIATSSHVPHDSALSVASSGKEDAARIRELESEVTDLMERTFSATQRYADYENEIRVLHAKLRQEQRKNTVLSPVTRVDLDSPAIDKPGVSRWGSFMTRKPVAPVSLSANSSPVVSSGPAFGAREKVLEAQLASEHSARLAAEQRAKEVSAEIEDLSASLFQQANEMVATERKENARLKERIEGLEKKRASEYGASAGSEAVLRENARLKERITALETREADRKRRLERLEAATKRIERVRAMLVPR